MAMLIATCCTLAVQRRTQRPLEVEDTGRIVSLADGSVLVAPDGAITSVLVDWPRDPSARRHRFEVGGTQFAPGAIAPVPEAKTHLGRLAQMLRAYPKVHLDVIGATNPGNNAENDQRLSEGRARLCAGLLVAAGVARDRLGPVSAHAPRLISDQGILCCRDGRMVSPAPRIRA
jgi:outer membrane protein OmpA-like peptidoglycan-associated protein